MLISLPTRRRTCTHSRSQSALAALSFVMLNTAWCFAQTGPGEQMPVPETTLPGTSQPARHQGSVTYAGGSLTVLAENSSLNEILREIAHQTGMKVTGRAPEDRVFGRYGPDSPLTVLTTLLDGSGINLLLVQDASHTPTELILTPRLGSPSPPNPNAQSAEEEEQPRPQTAPVIPRPQNLRTSSTPRQPATGGIDTNPAATSPSSTTQQIAFPPIDANTLPATATTTPSTPDTSNTVKTPQQIFEQLQKLRQQTPQPQN